MKTPLFTWSKLRTLAPRTFISNGAAFSEAVSQTSRAARSLLLLAVWTLCAIISSRSLDAQATTATLLGTVVDPSGGAVAGARLEAKNVGTGATRVAVSDNQGRYSIADLPVGDYEVQATVSGFQTVVRKGITLTVGSQTVVDFGLQVGQQQQTITVEGQVSQVETTSAAVATLIDQAQMRELPLNGRNFDQLILLAPGVQSYTSVSTASSFTGRSNSYSVAGARPEGQSLLLDNENLQTFWNRGLASVLGTSLGVEAIGEFQTLTNTFGAQFGGNGAVINAVSKSGTNALHGSAYDFLRNSALDARNFFDPGTSPPAFRKNQFGGSVGGRVKKDKAFFFLNYEGIRQLLGETKIAFVPDNNVRASAVPAVQPTLALFPSPTTVLGGGLGTVTQVANQIAHEDYILGRFDHTLSDKDSLFFRYLSDKSTFTEPFSGSNLPLWPESDNSHNQFMTLEEKRILSPAMVNTLHVSFSRPVTSAATTNSVSALQFFPGAGRQDGQVVINTLSTVGGNLFTPFYLVQNKFTEGDDIFYTHGAHSLRFGVSVERRQANTASYYRAGAVWTFNSLADFLAGNAVTVTGALPGNPYAVRDWRETHIEPYIQDDWKVSAKLTLNLGLRYAYLTNPVENHNNLYAVLNLRTDKGFTNVPHVFEANPATKNFDPRFGFAYDPFANHKTSIRGGFGMFHDPISQYVYAPGLWASPPYNVGLQSFPTYPIPFSSVSPSAPSIQPGYDYHTSSTPYMIQYNLTVQREIASGTIASVGYVGSRGVHLFTGLDQNPPTATIDSIGVYHFAKFVPGPIVSGVQQPGKVVTNPRVNTALGLFPDVVPYTLSRYNSLQASLNRRLTRNVQAQASYTWSKCMDNGSTFGSLNNNSPGSYSNPYDLSTDRGLCSFDIRQVLRINSLVALPFRGNALIEGWQLSGIFAASSGLPLTITSGFDATGLQNGVTNRPNLVAGRSPNPIVGSVNQWFDPSAFTLQPIGTLGNLGRDTVIGPGLTNLDLALLKDTKVRKISEQFRVQFRAEFFNVLNHANFGLPVAGVFAGVRPDGVTGIPNSSRVSGDEAGGAAMITCEDPPENFLA